MKKQCVFFLTVCFAVSASAVPALQDTADMVMFNGKIITVDEQNTIAQAVAVKDSLILKVGTNAEIQAYVEPGVTEMHDLNGLTVTPGIIDAHAHLMYYGQAENDFVNLRPPDVQDIADVVATIGAHIQTIEPGEWVIGDGFFRLEGIPTKDDLDPVSPDNPVFLNSLGGHYGSANSRALEIAGIDANTPNPAGGIIDRDDVTGEPTGIFWNHPAMDLIRRYYPPFDEEALTYDVIWAQDAYIAAGVTSFQDVNVRQPVRVRGYVGAVDSLKIRGYLSFTIERRTDAAFSVENMVPTQGPWLSMICDKFLLDGQPPTAYTYDPHLGPSYDLPTWNPDTLKKVVKDLHRAGHQLAFHVIGDAAIDLGLDAIEEALNETPRPDHRHRLEHVVLPTEQAIQRMSTLGVIASVQPLVIYTSGELYKIVFDEEIVQRMKPMRSFLDAGVKLALGTDYPTVPLLHPKYTLWSAVTRRTLAGDVIAPEECITIQEALYAHTMGCAYAAFEEDVKGSIEEGKYADMTIWSGDLYTIPTDELLNLFVRGIVVAGIVYENPQTGVQGDLHATVPDGVELYYNYPNPFNASTRIVYNLQKAGFTSLKIYNNFGQLVKTLVNHTQLPGKYIVEWDGTDANDLRVSSGQYYFQLTQGDRIIVKKALLLK